MIKQKLRQRCFRSHFRGKNVNVATRQSAAGLSPSCPQSTKHTTLFVTGMDGSTKESSINGSSLQEEKSQSWCKMAKTAEEINAVLQQYFGVKTDLKDYGAKMLQFQLGGLDNWSPIRSQLLLCITKSIVPDNPYFKSHRLSVWKSRQCIQTDGSYYSCSTRLLSHWLEYGMWTARECYPPWRQIYIPSRRSNGSLIF